MDHDPSAVDMAHCHALKSSHISTGATCLLDSVVGRPGTRVTFVMTTLRIVKVTLVNKRNYTSVQLAINNNVQILLTGDATALECSHFE